MDFNAFVQAAKFDVRVAMIPLLAILGIAAAGDVSFFLGMVSAVVVAVLLNTIIVYAKKRTIRFSRGSAVTGLIVGLIMSGGFAPALAAAIAIISKHLLKRSVHQMFNPAAFGAVVITFIFPFAQSWWVAGAPLWLVAAVGAFVVWRFGRIHEAVAYLVSTVLFYSAYILYLGAQITPLVLAGFFAGSTIFFATIMIIEPLSNPHSRNARIVFAVIVAFAGFLLGFIVPNVAIAAGLLVANALVPLLNKHIK